MSKKIAIISSLIALSLLASVPVLAASNSKQGKLTTKSAINYYGGKKTKIKISASTIKKQKIRTNAKNKISAPATIGTVSAINGNSITLTGKNGTTYTINATNAKIMKSGATIQLSGIQVGDTLMVRGTVNGTTVSATSIFDGVFNGRRMGPSVNGTVSSISGNSITLTGKNGTTYTINATNAKIMKSGATIQLSGIQVGDTLMVRGTVNGTTVSATSIFDGVLNR